MGRTGNVPKVSVGLSAVKFFCAGRAAPLSLYPPHAPFRISTRLCDPESAWESCCSRQHLRTRGFGPARSFPRFPAHLQQCCAW